MKRPTLICVVMVLLAVVSAEAQTNAPIAVASVTATNQIDTNTVVEPADLSRGASDVVKLFRSGKKDNVLIFYVNNAGLDYKLSADDIIYFKQIGLHSEVVTAMMVSDKEREKAVVVQSDLEVPTVELAGPTPVASAVRVAQQRAPVPRNDPQPVPSDTYSGYSGYANYYGPFNPEETGDHSSHVAVSVGIGLGLGVGTGYLDSGFYGYGRHFGRRR
jgi:hypothetical protein